MHARVCHVTGTTGMKPNGTVELYAPCVPAITHDMYCITI